MRNLSTTAISLAAGLATVLLSGPALAASWFLIQEGTPLSYLKGLQTPAAGWSSPSFQTGSEWTTSADGFGIGYGDGDDKTVLTDMQNGYMTVYVRAHFTLGPELANIKTLVFHVSFDDGFIAYLNGTEIARASMPPGAAAASTPAFDHEVTVGTATFSVIPSLLVPGDNVFAVEVHNASLGSSDLSFIPVLLGSEETTPVDALIVRGPYLQQVGRSSALVVWETDKAAPSVVDYGPTPALGVRQEDPSLVQHHVVALQGLPPATQHHYQVQSATLPSPVGSFSTELNQADPIRIGVFGDTRSNHADHASVVAGLVSDHPLLALHVGDLVSDGSVASDWDTFFGIEKELLRNAPLYPVLGNHENTGDEYISIFELPADSPSAERYYSMRYGPVRVWALDQYSHAYDTGSEQYTWLSQTLASAAQDPSIRHKVVVMHHGPYDSGSHGSNLTVRDDLVPLFEQYGVSVVFSGHDHDYERGTVNGIKYVVTGAGGAPLYSVAGDWWTEVSASVLEYCLMDVHGPRLEVTCKRTDGSQLDHFVIGDAVSECVTPADCASLKHGDCPASEKGQWECIEMGCIWNCSVPPPPDAGPDGPPPDGSPPGKDGSAGAAGGAGASGMDSGAAGKSGSGMADAEPAGAASVDEGGCGCRQAGHERSAAWGWMLLLAGAMALLRRGKVSPCAEP